MRSVARRFGKQGFAVGLEARNAPRLQAAGVALEKDGIRAMALPCDLGDPAAVMKLA